MKVVSKQTTQLVGVDFSSDQSFVSKNRSPMIVNMYKDYHQTFNTAIETRPGFRIEKTFPDGIVKGYSSKLLEGYLFIYADGGIYLYAEGCEKLLLCETENTPNIVDFYGKIYAYCGTDMFEFQVGNLSGEDAGNLTMETGYKYTKTLNEGQYLHVFDCADRIFVPTTYLTARDGTVSDYQGVNLVTGRQKNYFQTDGDTVSFTLIPYNPDGELEVLSVSVNGVETEGYDVLANIVTVSDELSDMDEVEVLFYEEIENPIAKCDVFYVFDERVFCGGYGSTYFWSGLKDPTYFPVAAYDGVDSGTVQGFFQVYGNLVISTESQTLLATEIFTDVETLPKTYPANALSNTYGGRVCGDFLNDPVLLTKYGLLGISNLDYYGERNLYPRSTLVNGKLTNEKDIENACLCVFREYLLILVNGNIYLANSRETFETDKDFEYEWYYWTNIGAEEDGIFFPATQIFASGDLLMFVTENGYIGIFNTDMVKEINVGEETGELVTVAYADDIASVSVTSGEVTISKKAIFSCYVTALEDFGYRAFKKSSRKVGNLCDLKAFSHTMCKIKTRSSSSEYKEAGSFSGDYMDFTDLDFANFTFSTSDLATFFFRPNQKKFQKSQLMLYSDEIYKPFGVLGIYQEIQVLGYAK